jgi:transcriptional regulator with XRE-family HTH domain
VASQFKPVLAFLGYDPTPTPNSLAQRFEANRRILGVTLEQVAQYLGWDEGSLRRYLKGAWRLSSERAAALEQFSLGCPRDRAKHNIANKISRGGFTAAFFLQCLKAIGCTVLRLEES